VELANDPSVAILVEHTSNLQDNRFCALHRPFAEPAFSRKRSAVCSRPDRNARRAIVSKRIKTFLRSSAGVQTIRVGNDFPFMDTFQSLIFTTSAIRRRL